MARREKIKRQERDKFYIITNGKRTEYNYFSLLKAKKSIYDVKVEFTNSDPHGLVEYARQYVPESNQVWVVFDVDNSYKEGRLEAAIRLADKNKIKYAFSNLAFEVWLIDHFQKCSQYLDTDGHKRVLDKYLSEQKVGLKYDKADEIILEKYFIPNYAVAVNYAKVVYQTRMKEHIEKYGESFRPPIWDWNSCTTVYKLVEALKLSN
ncbi:MAG: RloB family protein [Lachnospiraceae bacterium]|nr:RloB family protein [Lachnospiraceae bacterium]